jgi:hypothetical protein
LLTVDLKAPGELVESALLLSLLAEVHPILIGYYRSVPDSVPCLQLGFGTWLDTRGVDSASSSFGAGAIEWYQATDRAYWARSESERSRLRVALGRLNSATLDRDDTDRAIDLGIALEALFSSERDELGEITFKLRTRAARFLELEFAERLATSKSIAELYNLRSCAVHTGSLEKWSRQNKRQNLTDVLARGRSMVIDACQMIIRDGFPDWDEVLLDW